MQLALTLNTMWLIPPQMQTVVNKLFQVSIVWFKCSFSTVVNKLFQVFFFSATTCDSNCLKVHASKHTLNFILRLYKPINLWESSHFQYILQFSKQKLCSTNALIVLEQIITCFNWQQQNILLTTGRFSKADLYISIIKHCMVNTHEHISQNPVTQPLSISEWIWRCQGSKHYPLPTKKKL